MRAAINDTKILYKEDGTFFGINLGWNFVAEHEFGISGIEDAFRIPINDKALYGIDRRSINSSPSKLFFAPITINKDRHYILSLPYCSLDSNNFNKNGTIKSSLQDYFHIHSWLFDKQDITTAWDDSTFMICVKKNHKNELNELKDAFDRNDIAIFLGKRNNPFGNAGLYIVIKSKTDKLLLDDLFESDIRQEKIDKAVEKTKIIQKLKKAGKEYYALVPDFDESSNLIFFLNPREQHKYDAGWFTLEDLNDWIKEKGKIIRMDCLR